MSNNKKIEELLNFWFNKNIYQNGPFLFIGRQIASNSKFIPSYHTILTLLESQNNILWKYWYKSTTAYLEAI